MTRSFWVVWTVPFLSLSLPFSLFLYRQTISASGAMFVIGSHRNSDKNSEAATWEQMRKCSMDSSSSSGSSGSSSNSSSRGSSNSRGSHNISRQLSPRCINDSYMRWWSHLTIAWRIIHERRSMLLVGRGVEKWRPQRMLQRRKMEAEEEDEGNRGCIGRCGRIKLCYRARLYWCVSFAADEQMNHLVCPCTAVSVHWSVHPSPHFPRFSTSPVWVNFELTQLRRKTIECGVWRERRSLNDITMATKYNSVSLSRLFK